MGVIILFATCILIEFIINVITSEEEAWDADKETSGKS